jgi:4-amino-4-deoxychorismate lyase
MSLFVESIKLKDGVFSRLKLHQERVNKAFDTNFPDEEPISIFEILNQYAIPQNGIYKCRIVYDADVRLVEIVPYVRREIKSLKLVVTNIETRTFKPENRTLYNEAFAQRGDCDDVLLVRNGLLTDTSYCNVALYDGENWFTPRVPLLYGVDRADLLASGKLIEKDIEVSELKDYTQIALFNAMIEFGELVLEIEKVVVS